MDPEKIAKLKIVSQEHIGPHERRKRKAVAVLLFLLTAVLVLFLLYREGLLKPAIPVRITAVNQVFPSQAITVFDASGYVVAQRKASVASKGTGRLEYLAVREGSRVKKGDLLASLENGDLKAERAQTAGQLAAARSELSRAEADLRIAERAWKRRRNLLDQRAVAQADFENAEDQYLRAKAVVESARANIKALEASLRRGSILIEYTEIRAPFDGVVLTKDADVGEVVAPFGSAIKARAAVVTMADLSSLMVEADVAESFLSKVQEGQACEIQLDALPGTRFRGKVSTIVPTADRTRGTVLVKVQFDRLDPRILPEMSARVSFLARPLTDQEMHPFLAVHKEALAERNGASGVFKLQGNEVVWVPFTKMERLGDYAIPDPPLNVGEKVVLGPPAGLQSGDKIKVADQQ